MTVTIVSIVVVGVGCYLLGRLAGTDYARQEISDIAHSMIDRYCPQGVPMHAETDLEVMAQTWNALATSLDSKLGRTEAHHGK